MKQFKKILSFELKNYLNNKVFVGITVFLAVVMAIIMFFPRISEAIGGGTSDQPSDRPVMLISVGDSVEGGSLRAVFQNVFADYNVQSADSVEQISEAISSENAECAFVIDSYTSYTYYVNDLSINDTNAQIADSLMLELYRMNAMNELGISPEQVESIMSQTIEHKTEILSKDQFENFFYTYIMIFALYMVILLYGQMVATNVATEKSSRAMELLITSAKPNSMMFGKVIASCLAGLIQLICVFGSAILFYKLNESYWADNQIIGSIFNMPVDLLLYMLLFFVLGFFVYAFLYGAVGSTASKLEDINTSVMPITMLFIAGFFVVMFSLGSGTVDSTLMKVCSYIPFTSPMAMFTRIAMSAVSAYEIVISVIILLASVFGIGILSARVYRVGVLLYGTTPKIGAVLKATFGADRNK
jgi:hypothetical protein